MIQGDFLRDIAVCVEVSAGFAGSRIRFNIEGVTMHKVLINSAVGAGERPDRLSPGTGMTINPSIGRNGPIRRARFPGVLALAIGATAIATCMSVLSGWQRGGPLPERLVWVAFSVMMVLCAHLLPALCRSVTSVARLAATGLWVACMVVVCYGHATFFLFSQQHAGERRAEAVAMTAVTAPPVTRSGRSLAEIAADMAKVDAQLAANDARHCRGDCAGLRVTHVSLTARLDALGVEISEAKRREAAEDREVARDDRMERMRDSVRDDPFTVRLATWMGATTAQVNLLLGLSVATVLEGVASLCWYVGLAGRAPETIATAASAKEVAPMIARGHDPVVSGTTPSDTAGVPPVIAPEPDSCVERLGRDVAAGLLRPTVTGIRRHLHCSQAKAVALRQQLEARPASH